MKSINKEEETIMSYRVIEEERKVLRDNGITILSGEIDSCTAHEFVEDMSILISRKVDSITIIILSEGGQVEPGLACIRVIREAQKNNIKVIGSVHGIAMSMSFLILQACDVRKMGKLDILMAHGITSFTHGDIRNHDEEGKLLRFWKERFAELLSIRSNKDIDFWSAILSDNKPNYYTSEESLDMGLIDEVA